MRISDWSSDVCSSDLNIKGFAGEKGLEYYREIKVVNLGAQVSVPQLVARARAERADAVLVSQVVTQRDAPIPNTGKMSADRRSVVRGRRGSERVDLGGRRIIEKNKKNYELYTASITMRH